MTPDTTWTRTAPDRFERQACGYTLAVVRHGSEWKWEIWAGEQRIDRSENAFFLEVARWAAERVAAVHRAAGEIEGAGR